tara:strand:+ start:1140 stop:1292 length:153 start_codon:yes stop_codon:yes gene_type:complete
MTLWKPGVRKWGRMMEKKGGLYTDLKRAAFLYMLGAALIVLSALTIIITS